MSIDDKSARVAELIASCPDSHAEIAAKLGVDKSLVTRWRSGTRNPADAQLARLEDLYGGPSAAKPKPKRKAKPKPVAADLPALSAPDDDDDDRDENNIDRLRRYIRSGMRELENEANLSGVKKAEALKKLVDAQVALDRSTGDNAITMQRIVAHAEFKRIVRLITGAIAPFPDALAAVKKALETVRG